MKLATFTESGVTRVGVVVDQDLLDVSFGGHLPADMVSLFAGGAAAVDAVRQALPKSRRYPLAEVRIEAPVLRPRKFLGLGASYQSHLDESRIWDFIHRRIKRGLTNR